MNMRATYHFNQGGLLAGASHREPFPANMQDTLRSSTSQNTHTKTVINHGLQRKSPPNNTGQSSSLYLPTQKEFHLIDSTVVTQLELPQRPNRSVSNDWLTIVIFLSLIILASIRYSYQTYLKHLLNSLFNYSTAARMFQEKNYPISHAAYRLDLIFYISLPLFLLQTISSQHIAGIQMNLAAYLKTLGIVFGFFTIKKMLYRFVGNIFETRPETEEYLFNLNNFNRITGLSLLPIVIISAYHPFGTLDFTSILGLSILLVMFLALGIRGVSILLRKQFSIFYLILYLCTLEFLPLLLIYKVVVESK